MWHFPNDILQYRNGGYLLFRIGLYPFITILFGWVYNRTHGSILAPVLFHASMNSINVVQYAFPPQTISNVLLVLFAIFAVFYDRMWKKLPSDHLAVYQSPVSLEIGEDSAFTTAKLSQGKLEYQLPEEKNNGH